MLVLLLARKSGARRPSLAVNGLALVAFGPPLGVAVELDWRLDGEVL